MPEQPVRGNLIKIEGIPCVISTSTMESIVVSPLGTTYCYGFSRRYLMDKWELNEGGYAERTI